MEEKKEDKVCVGCHYFDDEDTYGYAWCYLFDMETTCGSRACHEYEERVEV